MDRHNLFLANEYDALDHPYRVDRVLENIGGGDLVDQFARLASA
jgi:hypothetical protein